MAGFLHPHPVEDGRGRREILAKALGEVGVDALVFLFE